MLPDPVQAIEVRVVEHKQRIYRRVTRGEITVQHSWQCTVWSSLNLQSERANVPLF